MQLTGSLGLSAIKDRARQLRLMGFDVDGVLTDGRIHFGPEGEVIKSFHTLDGHGIKMLLQAGIEVALITGRNSPMVQKRASDLGIRHVIQGREDKGAALAALADSLAITLPQCGYMGDDLPDVSAFEHAGLAVSVPNGHRLARQAAHLITATAGGAGAVRELCDFLLECRQEGSTP